MESVQLTQESALQLLVRFVNQAQTKGCFVLKEAALLHKSIVYLTKQGYQDDQDFSPELARNLLTQAVNIGQSKGAYNLDDAALLDRAMTFMENQESAPVEQEAPVQIPQQEESKLRVL